MIVEQRTYTLRPGSLRQFLALYETEGLAIQTTTLGNLLGYFVTEVGHLNRVTQLWGFTSYEDRLDRRRTLSEHPSWHEFLSRAGAFVEEQHSELLAPTTFSPIR